MTKSPKSSMSNREGEERLVVEPILSLLSCFPSPVYAQLFQKSEERQETKSRYRISNDTSGLKEN